MKHKRSTSFILGNMSLWFNARQTGNTIYRHTRLNLFRFVKIKKEYWHPSSLAIDVDLTVTQELLKAGNN